ncbi:MAG: hypothetical protein ACI9L9_002271, partial [Marivirga sp.]
ALYILKQENLDTFKEAALKRAKEFDVTNILPLYEAFYKKIVAQASQVVAKAL